MRSLAAVLILSLAACAQTLNTPEKQQVLWQKLETVIHDVDQNLDGVLGVHILDLTTGHSFSLHADEVFPQASTIKLAVLAELYRQSQEGGEGKAKLTDLYTVQKSDLVPDSFIMGGLTPGVTRITNRNLATMMVAVSDNSAANILIERVGMNNVNVVVTAQDGTTMQTYTYVDGRLHRTTFTSGATGVGIRLGGTAVTLGTHPLADVLRSLGLPKAALMTVWMEHSHGRFDGPVPV